MVVLIVGDVPEDQSFTHTIIEMFMVEANEAVARLLDSIDVPFIRRIHPEPDLNDAERLRQFVQVAGYKIPKNLDHKAIQTLLASVKGKPESFAISLAVLKSLTRAEYSPQPVGHYALASTHYTHFTSPIRRYADLTIHRLLDSYLKNRDSSHGKAHKKDALENIISYDDLVTLGKHISFTERRAEDAEQELRQVKILSLLQNHIGDEYTAVVTGITNFGIFLQVQQYLIDGLIRYEELMDDWWDVDERAGVVRGQRTGERIGIGDIAKVRIVNVDLARRELNLTISEMIRRKHSNDAGGAPSRPHKKDKHRKPNQRLGRGKADKGRANPRQQAPRGKRRGRR